MVLKPGERLGGTLENLKETLSVFRRTADFFQFVLSPQTNPLSQASNIFKHDGPLLLMADPSVLGAIHFGGLHFHSVPSTIPATALDHVFLFFKDGL